MEGLDVQCRQCSRVLHKTTEKYNPNKTANGSMVELLPKWKAWGWPLFYGGGNSTTEAARMMCPHCSGRLTENGKLKIKPKPKPVKTQAEKNQDYINLTMQVNEEGKSQNTEMHECEFCGRKIKSLVGYRAHIKACKRKYNA